MKKIIFAIVLLFFLAGTVLAQNIYHSSEYYDLRSLVINNSLPPISGTWYFVDPAYGDSTHDGLSIQTAVNRFDTAYARCVSRKGDGIAVISRDTGTSASTTCYITSPLVWAKYGITVYGIAAPTREFIRARVANLAITTGASTVLSFVQGTGSVKDKVHRTTGSFLTNGFGAGQTIRLVTTGTGASTTGLVVSNVTATDLIFTTTGAMTNETATNAGSSTVTSYMPYVINVTGSNNSFYNVQFGNYDADALALGGVIVTGDRNYFQNCNMMGANGTTPAADAAGRSLQLVGSQDNTFKDCTIGSDLTDRGNHASCEILFTVGAASRPNERLRFIGCETQSFVSTGTSHAAIGSSDAGSIRRDIIFKDCIFRADVTACASAFLGTAPTLGVFYMINSYALNYSTWDSNGSNNVVWIGSAATTNPATGIVTIANAP